MELNSSKDGTWRAPQVGLQTMTQQSLLRCPLLLNTMDIYYVYKCIKQAAANRIKEKLNTFFRLPSQ